MTMIDPTPETAQSLLEILGNCKRGPDGEFIEHNNYRSIGVAVTCAGGYGAYVKFGETGCWHSVVKDGGAIFITHDHSPTRHMKASDAEDLMREYLLSRINQEYEDWDDHD